MFQEAGGVVLISSDENSPLRCKRPNRPPLFPNEATHTRLDHHWSCQCVSGHTGWEPTAACSYATGRSQFRGPRPSRRWVPLCLEGTSLGKIQQHKSQCFTLSVISSLLGQHQAKKKVLHVRNMSVFHSLRGLGHMTTHIVGPEKMSMNRYYSSNSWQLRTSLP